MQVWRDWPRLLLPCVWSQRRRHQFEQSISGIKKTIEQLDVVKSAIPDRDAAEYTTRLLIENCLQNAVTAFQRVMEALHGSLKLGHQVRRNAFQNLVEGSQLWADAIDTRYEQLLPIERLERLTILFQQRHLLAHIQGIVDEDYVKRAGTAVIERASALWDGAESIDNVGTHPEPGVWQTCSRAH